MPAIIPGDYADTFKLVVSGWGTPTGSVDTRVLTLGDGQKVITRAVTGTAIFQHLTPITTPVIRVQWRTAQAQANNQNQKGGSIINLSTGTGFCAIHNGGNPGTIEIRAVTSGVMGGTALASAAATNNSFNDLFYADYTVATGEWKVYQAPEGINPVLKLTYSVTPMTGSLVGGSLIGGSTSNLARFEVAGVGGTVTSITNPVVPGTSFNASVTGFSTINGISSQGKNATNVVYSAGAVTANWPMPIDGEAYPYLPTGLVNFTLTDGASPAIVQSSIALPSGKLGVIFGIWVTDDPYYLGPMLVAAGYTLANVRRCYYPDSLRILPNGRVQVFSGSLPRTETLIIHMADGTTQFEDLNLSAEGSVVTLPTLGIVKSINKAIKRAIVRSIK